MTTPHAHTHDAVRVSVRAQLDAQPAEPDRWTPPEAVPADRSNGAFNVPAHVTGHRGRDDDQPVPTATTWPKPLGLAAYHGPFGTLVQAIKPQTEADPAAVLIQLLVMFGNVVGRTAHFCVEADTHHLNLFAALVGDTGKGRKGVSGGQARRIFQPIDSAWADVCNASGLSSGEGLIWAVRDPLKKRQPVKEKSSIVAYRTVIEDAGINDKRLLVVETELAGTLRVLGREGNTLSALIRQAWDGCDLRVLTKNSPVKATKPHISIIGHITRNELRRYLGATESANGFGNRFLWACVRRSKLLPDGGTCVALESHVERIRAAVDYAKQGRELRRDAAAKHLWYQEYPRLSTGRPGLLGVMTARAEAQVMRLACLYALGDMSYVVGRPHLQAALEVWRFCFDSATHIFGARLGDPTADAILSALKGASDGLTRSELLHGVFARNKSGPEIERALTFLGESGLVRSEEDRSGRGRPAERWFALRDTT